MSFRSIRDIGCPLDAIYLRKREPAVLVLRDDLIKPITIATLCILTDVLLMTNSMQRFLQ